MVECSLPANRECKEQWYVCVQTETVLKTKIGYLYKYTCIKCYRAGEYGGCGCRIVWEEGKKIQQKIIGFYF